VGEIDKRDVSELLTRLYKGILNREPDLEGFKVNYEYIMKSRKWEDIEVIIRTFVCSQEFRLLRGEQIYERQQPAVDYMSWDDIGRASDAWLAANGAPGSAYDEFRGKYLPLPDWFDSSLDPFSSEYAGQQDRLWHLMVGEQKIYDAKTAELTMDDLSGPIAHAGLYGSSSQIASHHIIALGNIIKHSNIKRGDRVLEYGAGRGDIAVNFARLGAEVHTIDVDPNFCDVINRQASFFGVSLTPHLAEFGENPAGGQYNLIYFHEAFHHARNFQKLIASFRGNLAPGGKVLMAGEPINPKYAYLWPFSCPYPWGIRLEAEVAAIVRYRGWYELGFTQEFLVEAFARHGFSHRVHPADISSYATVHEFWP